MKTLLIILSIASLTCAATAQITTNQEVVQVKTANGLLTSYGMTSGANKIVVTDSAGRRIVSSTLPGTPLAPTAAVGTNTTQIATTAFVRANAARFLGTATISPSVPLTSLVGQAGDFAFDTSGSLNVIFEGTGSNALNWYRLIDEGWLGTGAGNIVQLDGSGFLPALNGSLLTALNASAITSGSLADARIASAATWNAKESALTFSAGLTRSTNTITVNGAAITGITQSQVSGLTTTSTPTFANLVITPTTLTYAATTNIDFDANGVQTVSLTGNVTFTTSNRGAGKSKTIRIIADASSRTLTFPSGWVPIGAALPTSIAANKTAVLTVFLFGTADTDAVIAYAVQP